MCCVHMYLISLLKKPTSRVVLIKYDDICTQTKHINFKDMLNASFRQYSSTLIKLKYQFHPERLSRSMSGHLEFPIQDGRIVQVLD